MKRFVLILASLSLATALRAEYIPIAYDTASNYTNWVDGSTGGMGFDLWRFHVSGDASGFKGAFLAETGGNQDLNYVWSVPGYKAWGTYANGGSEKQNMVAFRGFGFDGQGWANALTEPKQVFRISFENGPVDTSGGLVGFTLRNGNADGSTGNYGTGRRFEFGFKGGETNYYILDASGKVDTGLGWRDSGFHCTFELQTTDSYAFAVRDARTGVTVTNLVGTLAGAGSIDSVALFNRDSQSNGDVFFNNLEIQRYRPPTVFVVR